MKKKIFDSIYKRSISLMLAFCIIATAILSSPLAVKASEKEYVVTEEGITYHIVVSGKNVTLSNDDSLDKEVFQITDEAVIHTTYEYEGTNFFGIEKYDKTTEVTEIEDYELSEDNVTAQAISYNTKVKETLKNNYWYQIGNDGSKTYLKIGNGSSTYRIRTDDLSSAKRKKCDAYMSSIKSCSKNAVICVSAWGAVGLGLACALIASGVGAPAGVLVVLISAALGGGTSSAMAAINGYFDYLDIKDYYNVIKSYGTAI